VISVDADLLSWADIHAACACLAGEIRGGGLPDVVVGVSRGGLVPAVLVSHLLGLRDLRTLAITRTCSDTVGAAKLSAPAVRYPASLGSLQDLDVLVIDDVAGSGETIAAASGMATSMRARRARTAVCVVNDANWADGPFPDHVAIHARRWVIFPWEPS
jgi:hypoxanthine phosphoribosyltransferase